MVIAIRGFRKIRHNGSRPELGNANWTRIVGPYAGVHALWFESLDAIAAR